MPLKPNVLEDIGRDVSLRHSTRVVAFTPSSDLFQHPLSAFITGLKKIVYFLKMNPAEYD
jgi:hypothetical protein